MLHDSSQNRDTPPIFFSTIPAHLLIGVSDKDRWIMENISTLNQKTDWQSKELMAQSVVIERVEEQVLKTNGRVLVLEGETKELKEKTGKLSNVFKNKYTWITIGVVLIFVAPAISKLVTVQEIIKFFIG